MSGGKMPKEVKERYLKEDIVSGKQETLNPKEDTCECNIYMEEEELCAKCQEERGGEND